MVAQPRGGPGAIRTLERRQAAAGDGARPLELVVALGRERRVDQGPGNPTRSQLRAQARGAVAARRASSDPMAGEGSVVEMATRDEIGEDIGSDRRRRTAPAQARRQLTRGPGASRKEIGGDEPRGPRVEGSARTARTRYDLLKKELPAGETGTRSSRLCSNDCSPVEKMPRTLRSKSSALVAASRAVSYEMMPSR
jgi:hypothetical protein